jgi:putative addiction module component (TIGR02574 family)
MESAMLNAALKAEISTLTLQEKLEVFEVIRSSVMPASDRSFSELSAQQEQELLRRAEHAAAAPSAGRSWAEVKQRLGN